MANDVFDLAWRELNKRVESVEKRLQSFTATSERAETSGGMAQSALADAPLAISGAVRNGDYLFITDGRKGGEGAGAGTGVPAYYNAATDQWFTFSADAAVTV